MVPNPANSGPLTQSTLTKACSLHWPQGRLKILRDGNLIWGSHSTCITVEQIHYRQSFLSLSVFALLLNLLGHTEQGQSVWYVTNGLTHSIWLAKVLYTLLFLLLIFIRIKSFLRSMYFQGDRQVSRWVAVASDEPCIQGGSHSDCSQAAQTLPYLQ